MPTAEEVNSLAAAQGALPDPLLTVSEWSDRYRTLSQRASAEPGPWRTDRTPYLREIMDCLSPSSPVETVVLMKGVQIGGTECGNNWIGYIVHQPPGPMLAVQPTVDMAKRNSNNSLAMAVLPTPGRPPKMISIGHRRSLVAFQFYIASKPVICRGNLSWSRRK